MVTAAATSPGPTPRTPGKTVGRIVAGVVVAIAGALNSLYWLAVWGLHCFEDGCPDTGTWKADVNAWQWSAMGWLGIASVVCCVAAAIALARRWRRAGVLVGAAVLSGLAPWIVSATG
jgi:hypothetical protein